MPSYHVEFATSAGSNAQASINAPSLPALAGRLAENGCTLVRVFPPQPDPQLKGYWRRVTEGEVSALLRQLAGAIDNGVSVAESFALMARESRNPTLRGILTEIERAVRGGDSLSAAMARYPRLFTAVHLRLLEAGEAGAGLPEVLRHLATYAERANQASQRLRTSLIYPQVVGAFTMAVMVLMFLFVVPKFVDLFVELGMKGEDLPFVTASLMWMSAAVLPSGLVVLPLAVAGGYLWIRRAERRGTFRWAYVRSRVPVFGPLYFQYSLLRLTRLLAALISGGVPILEALRLAGQGCQNPVLQAAMWDAIPRAAAGRSLGSAFSHSGILPPTFCGQIAAAEAGGNLPEALSRLADWYGDRIDYLAARVGAIVEPFFVFVLAGLAAWVAIGAFAPLIAVIQNLSGGGVE